MCIYFLAVLSVFRCGQCQCNIYIYTTHIYIYIKGYYKQRIRYIYIHINLDLWCTATPCNIKVICKIKLCIGASCLDFLLANIYRYSKPNVKNLRAWFAPGFFPPSRGFFPLLNAASIPSLFAAC